MARYEYGGAFNDLVVTPDGALGGALKAAPATTMPPLYNKPVWDGTRVIVTDFLIDATGDGNLNDAASSLTTDAAGYPPRFLGPDGVNPLYDLLGHHWDPVNQDAADVPLATTTAPGIAELATSAETVTGVSTTLVSTPAGVAAAIADHDADTSAHSDLRDQADANTLAMQSKADLVGGVVPVDQIDASDSGAPEKIAKYTVTGALAGADGLADAEYVTRLQFETGLADSASVGADVRYKILTPPAALVSSSSFTTLSTLGITDGQSGQTWLCEYCLSYTGVAASGLSIRMKQNVAGVATNKLANPEAAVNTNNWAVGSPLALGRGTSGAVPAGTSSYFTLTALTAATAQGWNTDPIPAAPGSVWTAAAYFMTQVGTPRSCRVDIQFMDATGNVAVSTILGTPAATNGATYTRISSVNSGTTGSTAPSGTVYARVRVAVVTPAVGDVIRMGAVQLEPSTPLPVYGATGGGGTSALEIDGYWSGLINTAAANTDYTKLNTIHYPADPSTTGTFGGLGASINSTVTGSFHVKVVGIGLTDQVIVPEVAQRSTDAGNPTTLIHGRATLARVV